jgi:hypothetical protein
MLQGVASEPWFESYHIKVWPKMDLPFWGKSTATSHHREFDPLNRPYIRSLEGPKSTT